MTFSPLFVFGDVHGHLDKMVHHLRHAGLATANGEWAGGDAHLWFMGDFTDRGPDGVGVIDFVMRLQKDAATKGGQVGALLGNHDVGILAAYLFPHAPTNGPAGTFYADWIAYGGITSDLARLQPQHVEWLQKLYAMALVQDRLLVHADALYYRNYGETIEQVNAATRRLLHNREIEKWDELLGYAGERFVFDERTPGGNLRARQFLAQFGGKQIIHGHTTIPNFTKQPFERVTGPYMYAEGLVVDVDGGMYRGGRGFVYRVPRLDAHARDEHEQLEQK